MCRLVPPLFVLAAPFSLASCLLSPDPPSAPTGPVAAISQRPESVALDGDGGGILLRENRLGEWCTCPLPPPAARVRTGIGLRFAWSVVDPVAADRFALFRFSIDGSEPSDWGEARFWPEDLDGEPLLWFPDAGMHVFRLEKQLNGVVSGLDAEFEVLAR
jgi:hypothetical protein